MKIEITTAFNDTTKPDGEDRRVEIGATPVVTAERGAYLIELGLAKAADDVSDPAPKTPPAAPKN